MNINFKGGYFNLSFFLPNQNYSGPWTNASESLDWLDFVHGLLGLCRWTMSSPPGLPGLCLECVHGQCPDCPLSPWPLSMDSLDFVSGHCPVQLVSLDFVHELTGLFPECPWTLSRFPWTPWTFNRWVRVELDLNTTSIKRPRVLRDHLQILPRVSSITLTCIKRPTCL